MSASDLKNRVLTSLWSVVDNCPAILSATLVGSFAIDAELRDVSDIDLVIILDRLDAGRYESLLKLFGEALRPEMAPAGYDLRINPTLGPLKLNDPNTAVLHLMLYTRQSHVEHAVNSPFTCLDWQRSPVFRKQSLFDIYPVFGLQPHHFFGARRSATEYLKDFRQGVVSYREIAPSADGYEEIPRTRLMGQRDRHEFAYHVMKFLMQNFLKLVHREAEAPDGEALLTQFFSIMPEDDVRHSELFRTLRTEKQSGLFEQPVPEITERVTAFVQDFERQFRAIFFETSTQHLFFRHAKTALNGTGIFLGRADPDAEPINGHEMDQLVEAAADISASRTYASPLTRCRQSLETLSRRVALPTPIADNRLLEMDYGTCDGLTTIEARALHPDLFAAWARNEDPPFPGGENTEDVLTRLDEFVSAELLDDEGDTLTCTHNVVLRCLVGELLNVPQNLWHRLYIPHLAPIRVINTGRYGLFLDLDEGVERAIFRGFSEP